MDTSLIYIPIQFKLLISTIYNDWKQSKLDPTTLDDFYYDYDCDYDYDYDYDLFFL